MSIAVLASGDAMSPQPRLSFGAWLATEGGRKCPQCGRYAKESELGYIGWVDHRGSVTMYGHLPGFGCNRIKP